MKGFYQSILAFLVTIFFTLHPVVARPEIFSAVDLNENSYHYIKIPDNRKLKTNLTAFLEEKSWEEKEYKVPMVLYYQNEIPWATHLYGGNDPMSSHGCGPTILSMLVTAFNSNSITPTEAADWSSANGYYAVNEGSHHGLIPQGSISFGLKAEVTNNISFEAVQQMLSQNKLIVLLVGPGTFTDGGHFIIIRGYTNDGQLYIADPASKENSHKTWTAEFLESQLANHATDGGPIWVISKP